MSHNQKLKTGRRISLPAPNAGDIFIHRFLSISLQVSAYLCSY